MLDPTTTLINLVTTMLLSLLIWGVIALTQRKIPGVPYLLLGVFLAIFGFGLRETGNPLSPGWYILLYGVLIQASQAVMAIGFLHLLNIYRFDRLCYLSIAIIVLAWAVALAFDPYSTDIRKYIATTDEIAVYSVVVYVLLWHCPQSLLVRSIGTSIMVGHILANLFAIIFPTYPSIPLLADAKVWLLYEANIFFIALLLFTMLLVLNHLWGNLRQTNEALNAEIAERLQLQHQLASSLDKEVALRREQQEMVRLVSHELRTPLAMINRSVEMIRFLDRKPPEEVNTRLENIQTAANRLIALVERFLNRASGPDTWMKVETVDLSLLLDTLLEHFRSIDSAHRLRPPAALPNLPCQSDPEILLTVLINIAGNALKYSPADNSVELGAALREGDILITIADRGIGIPPEEVSRIGERHFRASNVGNISGSGTGLFHSLRLLDLLGGTLAFSQREGGGTIATIRLSCEWDTAPRNVRPESRATL